MVIASGMSPKQVVKKFGAALKAERARRGLSLRELAELADTSHQTVSAFEEGTGTHLPTLIRIAKRLGLQLELTGG